MTEQKKIRPIILDTERSIAEYLLNMDFSGISKDLLDMNNFEIQYPSEECLFDSLGDEYFDDYEELNKQLEEEEIYIDELIESNQDTWDSLMESIFDSHYPMWNTLFFATGLSISKTLEKNIDKLYGIGLGVFTYKDEVGIFVPGGGYCFWTEHWIKLYKTIIHSPLYIN